MSDYDMSIHQNPDAAAWAAFFKETFPDSDEELMLGWFANAMMAMADHLEPKYEKRIRELEAIDELLRHQLRKVVLMLRVVIVVAVSATAGLATSLLF